MTGGVHNFPYVISCSVTRRKTFRGSFFTADTAQYGRALRNRGAALFWPSAVEGALAAVRMVGKSHEAPRVALRQSSVFEVVGFKLALELNGHHLVLIFQEAFLGAAEYICLDTVILD